LEVSERKQPKVRKQVKWNTGERIHKSKKGKGSYDRKEDKPKEDN
jgi:stalled ribosome alternative rescue factor ArfA